MNKIDDELIQGCKRFLDDMNRVEQEKKKKEEEERIASEKSEARRNYWENKLYSDKSQGMTIILPENSKLKK
jgi:BRCT domain type II-containing protein